MLHRIVCALSVVAVLAAQQSAPPSRSVELLLGKARALEARGRMDLAVQTWKQLLMVEPGQQDAIAGLARAAKLEEKQPRRMRIWSRLRKSNPANPAIRQIETIGKAAKHNPDLDVAAKLAASGESEKAIAIYRPGVRRQPSAGGLGCAHLTKHSPLRRAAGKNRRLRLKCCPEITRPRKNTNFHWAVFIHTGRLRG